MCTIKQNNNLFTKKGFFRRVLILYNQAKMNINSHVELCGGNANVSRTQAHPAPCVLYFYVFARSTRDLSKALILSTIRLGRNMFFRDCFVAFSLFRKYFLISMRVVQKGASLVQLIICVNVNIRDDFLRAHWLFIYQFLNKTVF